MVSPWHIFVIIKSKPINQYHSGSCLKLLLERLELPGRLHRIDPAKNLTRQLLTTVRKMYQPHHQRLFNVKKLKSNIKNKNMNPEIKIDMRDTLIKEMVEVNGLPQDDYPSMRDIESVLILNKLPKRATEKFLP